MVTRLHVDNDILSLTKGVSICTDDGQEKYRCERTFGLFRPGWQLWRKNQTVAKLKPRVGLAASWDVEGALSPTRLKRRLASLVNTYDVELGPFAGAVMKGTVIGRRFEIAIGGVLIARGSGQVMTPTDGYEIEIYEEGELAEVLTVACMVAMRAEELRGEGEE